MTQSQDYIIALQSLLWLLAKQAPWIYWFRTVIQSGGFNVFFFSFSPPVPIIKNRGI